MILKKIALINWYRKIVNGETPKWEKIKTLVDSIRNLRDKRW